MNRRKFMKSVVIGGIVGSLCSESKGRTGSFCSKNNKTIKKKRKN